MAVYGNMLNFFPELFRRYNYFSMTPNSVASYTPRENLGVIRGILQFMKKGELERENEVLVDVNVPTFWTKTKLKIGNFLEIENDTYRIKNDYPWFFEGGFYCYGLETVNGSTDSQEQFDYVDIGQNGYD